MVILTVKRNWLLVLLLSIALSAFGLLQISRTTATAGEKDSQTGQVHESVIAGSWYPDSPNELRDTINAFLDGVPKRELSGELVSLISPHAGYAYSGQVAAYAYKLLRNHKFDTVIIIAPSHHAAFSGISVYDQGGYRTPLGLVPLDRDLIRELKDKDTDIHYVPEAHAREHSLEIQLPFLQTVMPGFKLVPLVMGDQSYATCKRLADAVAQCSRGKSVLIVASSDLSHFHSYQQAKELDQVIIDHVTKFDPQGLSYDLARGKCEACGGGPIVTALLASRELGANATDVLYSANSGDVTGDRSRVVGYLAAAIYKGTEPKKTLKEQKQAGIDLGLSTEDKALLHRIAKESIEAHCAGKEPPTFEVSSARLKESRGAFVTLHKNGELRGCIGHIIGDRSLAETVAEMAVAAAFQDPRFPPVTADELPDLDIEISAMTPLRRITDVEEIQVGRDGIIVQQDGHSGLLLPQVATQYGWDRETFLDYTCRKANLPPDAWKDKNTTIYIFSADVF